MTTPTTDAENPPLSPDLFHGLSAERPHLCGGSAAPLLRSMESVLRTYADARADGMNGRGVLERAKSETARRIAELLGQPASSDHVAFAPSTGHALDTVARAIDWREGDEVIVPAEDFPSVILPWRPLESRGVSVRVPRGGDTPETAILEATNAKTRVVCLSHVNWRTGLRVDLERLSAGLRPKGIRLVVDAGHSLGVLPVPGELCDVVVGCGHKFMLGLHGVAALYWRDVPDPARSDALAGWYSLSDMDGFTPENDPSFKGSASAFEPGNPNFIGILALGQGVETLRRAGMSKVSRHAVALAGALRDFLDARGIPALTPAAAERRGTSIAIPDPLGAELAKALADDGIMAAHGVGRLRISFHGYNTERDLERVKAAISQAARP